MDNSQLQKKKPMTHEERLALAAKLDQELDDFIAGLEKKKYTDGWPEDRWQEEMEKHPFFMTKLPEDGKLSPLLEGIQQLKYDENENTPLDLAKAYKEDGNFNFKYKKYRMAIISYTEGIRKRCGDVEVEAQLYNNRAAAQFNLGNYRSCLADCRHALKLKANYLKTKVRAAQCCAKLKMHNDAVQYCDEILQEDPENQTALKIRSEAATIKKQQERDNRKQKLEDKKHRSELVALKTAIDNRNILVEGVEDILDSLENSPKKPLLKDGELLWSVVFVYPEHYTSDLVEQFNENSTFWDHLVVMFSEHPDWDKCREYHPEVMTLYYEGLDSNKVYQVDVHSTLSKVLSSGTFAVRFWQPTFFVFIRGSSAEAQFLKCHNLEYN